MIRRAKTRWKSAAARRLCRLAGNPPSIESAVSILASDLLRGISCPPTDLDAIMARLNVTGHEARHDLAGSGALLRDGDNFKIIYSCQMPNGRKRWTIAHELAHALFEKSGPNAPRHGRELERLCDMIATELLLPRKYFAPRVREGVCLDKVLDLADIFQTSVAATAIRCAEICRVSVFETEAGRLRWGYGTIRNQYDLESDDVLARLASLAVHCQAGSEESDLTFRNKTRRCIVEWKRIGSEHRRLFMLRPA